MGVFGTLSVWFQKKKGGFGIGRDLDESLVCWEQSVFGLIGLGVRFRMDSWFQLQEKGRRERGAHGA